MLRVECKGRRVRLVVEERILPNGKTRLVDRVEFPNAVVVLPLLTNNCRVGLIRQYRPAIDEWLLEAPAGVIDEGETPEQAAARELEEEAGLRPTVLEKVAEGYASPGYSTEILYYYLAPDPKVSKARPEEYEVIEGLEWYDIERALEMIRSGQIRDSKTILLILSAARICGR